MDLVESQKRSLQQLYARLRQNNASFLSAISAYNRIVESGLFDHSFYDVFYPDARESGLEPLAHYILCGSPEGRNPHPLFDGSFYLGQIRANVKATNALEHYLDNYALPAVNPHPLFDWQYYETQSVDIQKCSPLEAYLTGFPNKIEDPLPLFDSAYYLNENPDVVEANINPLVHFVLLGASEGRSPHPLFDTKYYLDSLNLEAVPIFQLSKNHSQRDLYEHAAFVIRSKQEFGFHNALVHYMGIGSTQGLSPHPLFSSSFYLQNHPEIAEEFVNPLVHYVTKGAKEGLSPHALFDPLFYARGVKEKFGIEMPVQSLLFHFLESGFENLISPHPHFDSKAYVAAYETVRTSKMNPLVHYLTEPSAAQRITNHSFDGEFYAHNYGDVRNNGMTPLEHFARFGERENRACNFKMWAQKNGKTIDQAFGQLESDDVKSFPFPASCPQVSIILHGSNSVQDLSRCLMALERQNDSTSVELIVTNAGREERMLLDRLGINVRDKGANGTEAINRAASESSGEILVFLKSNLAANKKFLRVITAFFEQHASPLVLSPLVVTEMGRTKHGGFLLTKKLELEALYMHSDAFCDEERELRPIDVALRDSLIIRKSDFLRLNGFDSRFSETKYDDVDFCLRAKRKGYEILSHPGAILITLGEFAHPSVRDNSQDTLSESARRKLIESYTL